MDTKFFHAAVRQYQLNTGDNRSFAELPVDVQSRIVQDAQALKMSESMEAWIKGKKEEQK